MTPGCVDLIYALEHSELDCSQQIHIDIPRTNPLIPLFQQPLVQEVSVCILLVN